MSQTSNMVVSALMVRKVNVADGPGQTTPVRTGGLAGRLLSWSAASGHIKKKKKKHPGPRQHDVHHSGLKKPNPKILKNSKVLPGTADNRTKNSSRPCPDRVDVNPLPR